MSVGPHEVREFLNKWDERSRRELILLKLLLEPVGHLLELTIAITKLREPETVCEQKIVDAEALLLHHMHQLVEV